MILVKLGGSVITDKNRLRRFRRANCIRLARELRTAEDDLVLVHGAGSFGHIRASEAQLNLGVKKGDRNRLRQISRIHADVRELNSRVLSCLVQNGLNAFSLPPHSFSSFKSGEIAEFCPDIFQSLLDNDMVPLSFGDIVPDEATNYSVCSGDLIMAALAEHFRPKRVLFVADVDGIFDSDPKTNRKARLLEEVTSHNLEEITTRHEKRDVTGSMAGKINRMLDISRNCENCIILNGNAPGRLEKALRGGEIISTKVVY